MDEWPLSPYKGLEYFGAKDAVLFTERGVEVENCAALFVKFDVKILVLQGSSGVGKSSFLRAGLIPRLQRGRTDTGHHRDLFFLPSELSVIRSTRAPLEEAAKALRKAFSGKEPFIGKDGPYNIPLGQATRKLLQEPHRPSDGPACSAEELREQLIETIHEICGNLPGQLVLVFDQVEEALTRPGALRDKSAQFFRFLEQVYLRNIDAKIIVSLRTEYYGLFRDELRIQDDWLSSRPKRGGIESFLLRPLRDPEVLKRVIRAPSELVNCNGRSVYRFQIETSAIEEIVTLLLQAFPGAVTPALQLICKGLYEELGEDERVIRKATLRREGGIKGIFHTYLDTGVEAAGVFAEREKDKWFGLLLTLVGRQGNGLLVSQIASADRLVSEAKRLQISGDPSPLLVKLSAGDAPLLRGEPPDNPVKFSLKHDVLALPLVRWGLHYEAACKAKRTMLRWLRIVGGAVGAVVVLSLLIIVGINTSKTASIRAARERSIELTNTFAIQSPNSDFRQSLLLLVSSLRSTTKNEGSFDWISGAIFKLLHDKPNPDAVRERTVNNLREVLLRSPWFSGEYQAAGMSVHERVRWGSNGRAFCFFLFKIN